MALAADSYQYTPPKHIKAMEADLAMMPLLWGGEDDAVLSFSDLDEKDGWNGYVQQFDDREPLELKVWGWNKALRNRLIHFGCPLSLLPSEMELEEWRRMASREYAVKYACRFYENWQKEDVLVDNRMSFCCDEHDLNGWIGRNGYPFVTKTPYSSSGRGLHIIKGEDDDVSKLGQNFLIDRFYEKVMDFAMEFCVDEEKVDYLGLSVFEASKEGKYAFNYVKSQSALRDMLLEKEISDANLAEIRNAHLCILKMLLVGHYKGIVGIDMMIVKNGDSMLIHSCVELNLRMNMGVVAMKLYEKGIDRIDVSDNRDKHFFPRLENGTFFIEHRR